MKNKGITIFLIILTIVIIAVIVSDFISKRPDRSSPNPFEYNVDEYINVDPSLIHYKESKNFRIGMDEPAGIEIENGYLFVVGDNQLIKIDTMGNLHMELALDKEPRALEIHGGIIYIGFRKQVVQIDNDGKIIDEWPVLEGNSHITALSASNEFVFVADAGKRRILKYSKEGVLIDEFDGKNNTGSLHGFIVPSPYFDIDINSDDELWVVNPGIHALENYTFEGNLRTFWKNASMRTGGFSGCCNPAHFTFLHDGRFVTSEKGLVRIKIYKRSGEFEGVVAAPVIFQGDEHAPDIATDSRGNIYALDFNKKLIRMFIPL